MNAKINDSKLTTRRVFITPETAEGMLAKVPDHQRSLSSTHVDKLAEEMRAGRWLETGDTIKFDDDDKLLDGQHRLHALVLAADKIKGLWFLLAKGVDPDSFKAIDIGRKRTPGDMFSIAGYENATAAAAVTRMLISVQYSHRAGLISIRKPTADEMLQYASKHLTELKRTIEIYYKIRKLMTSAAPIAATLSYLHRYADHYQKGRSADEFTTMIIEGANLKARSAALILRNHLCEQDGAGHALSCRRIAEVISMFSAYVRGMDQGKMIPLREDPDSGVLIMPLIHVDEINTISAAGKIVGRSASQAHRVKAKQNRHKKQKPAE